MSPEEHILESLKQNISVVIVTVCETSGSVPRGPGAKLIVFDNGSISGTIGGGNIEAKAIETANEIFNNPNTIKTLFFQLNSGDGLNMLCGGAVTLMFEHYLADDRTIQQFHSFVETLNTSDEIIWIVDFKTSTRKLFPISILKNQHPGSHHKPSFKQNDYYLEPIIPKSELILIGAGHVSAAVAEIAMTVGFNITVIDDRIDFLTPDRFPHPISTILIDQFTNIPNILNRFLSPYIVILTRNHSFDEVVLEASLNTKSHYVGMIGSRKKRDAIYDNLKKKGVTSIQLSEVHSPIGLNIGAETPEEIAVSIIAELIHERSK